MILTGRFPCRVEYKIPVVNNTSQKEIDINIDIRSHIIPKLLPRPNMGRGMGGEMKCDLIWKIMCHNLFIIHFQPRPYIGREIISDLMENPGHRSSILYRLPKKMKDEEFEFYLVLYVVSKTLADFFSFTL